MSNWGDIKTLVTYNLGRVGDSNITTLLPIWADLFQKKAQRDRNWWFLKTVAERTIDSASQSYPLPSNFKDDMFFYIKQTTPTDNANAFIELDPITDLDVIRTYEPVVDASQKAQPEAYVIGDQTVTFWPWPDKAYVIKSQYWKDIAPPVASSLDIYTNAWIRDYPDLYSAELTAMGFKYLQEVEDAREWTMESMKLLNDIRAAHVARELAGNLCLTPVREGKFGTTRQSQNAIWRVYN